MIAQDKTNPPVEETDFLIAGAGPAGASLACFLAEYGLKGILIASAPSTSDTPRAHITNMAALECLRDIGLEEEALKHSTVSKNMEHTRWCRSMAGEEFGRIHSWGNDPHRKGDYYDASPCNHVDLPQTLCEPILVNRAKERGWDVRFSNKLVSFEDHGPDKGITSTIEVIKSDDATDSNGTTISTYTVHSQYLFGCDGGRSTVVRQLDIPLIKKPGGGLALNIRVETDLSRLIESRVGNLHWAVQPDQPHPKFGWMCVVRMVKPWHEWMFIMFPDPDWDPAVHGEPTWDEYLTRVHEFIGDDSIPVKILDVSKWNVNEIVAEHYSNSSGNIHCLGDAVHRHPPFNGLGSNTCIQDAYNLAWKIAYTMRGTASPRLLTSYSIERQPVGLSVITRANQGFRDHLAVWQALGMTEGSLEACTAAFNELSAHTAEGTKRREALRDAIKHTETEFHAVGQEMNQKYDDSPAVYFGDEQGPRPPLPENPVLYYQISTYPGSRLPHAWVNRRVPEKAISTQDLVGKGVFTLITGPGDWEGGWRRAAESVSKELGVEVKTVSIGWGCEWEDVYSDWGRRKEVNDDGCILVRPDRFVAWRSMTRPENPVDKLRTALRAVLCLDE